MRIPRARVLRHFRGAAALSVALVAGWLVTTEAQIAPADPLAARGHHVTGGAAPGYVDDQLCASCHRDIYDSYQDVAMARSFYRPEPSKFIEDFESRGFFHVPSRRHYRMERRDDNRLVMHRYQLDDRGERINIVEQEVDWILGSGNHSRTYLYRVPSGNLYQLPIAWYTQTQSWGMAPGFDNSDHLGLQRRVRRECMFCHNAYPDVPETSASFAAPHFFPEELPQGLGCQRCHGPGAEHARAAMHEPVDFKAVYAAIVNPGDLEPRLRDDVCYQCHLQPTVAIPGQRRFGADTYAYRPGQPLADYMVHLDIVEHGRERADRFEINHHPYRLEQSRCFLESAGELSCLSCHDPHRKVPTAERASHYRAACLQCHQVDACKLEEMTADATLPDVAADNCVGCHMQERRPEDVVLVTMTDHFIRRRPGGPELVAVMAESTPNIENVELLHPKQGPDGALADIYRAVAVLEVTGGRIRAALDGLETRLPAIQPGGLEPYFELANAQLKLQRPEDARHTLEKILKTAPDFLLAQEVLALTESTLGQRKAAIARLFEVLEHSPQRPETHFNLGANLFQEGRLQEARSHFERAIELRPVMESAWFYLGLAQTELGQLAAAADSYRRTVALDPAHDRAYLALSQVLILEGQRGEALRYLRHGVKHSKAPSALAAALARATSASAAGSD